MHLLVQEEVSVALTTLLVQNLIPISPSVPSGCPFFSLDHLHYEVNHALLFITVHPYYLSSEREQIEGKRMKPLIVTGQ